MAADDLRTAVLRMVEARDEVTVDVDGYAYWFPSGSGGLSAPALRIIADELDRRNAEWDAVVRADQGA